MKYVRVSNDVYVNLEKVRAFEIKERKDGKGLLATFYYAQNVANTQVNIFQEDLDALIMTLNE